MRPRCRRLQTSAHDTSEAVGPCADGDKGPVRHAHLGHARPLLPIPGTHHHGHTSPARPGPLSRPAHMRTAGLCRALAQAACSPGRAAHAITGADHACNQSCHRADCWRIQLGVPALMRAGIRVRAGTMRPRMQRWSPIEDHKAPIRLPEMPAGHARPFDGRQARCQAGGAWQLRRGAGHGCHTRAAIMLMGVD